MPLRSVENAARTLVLYERLQEVLANNLANAPTDGFKADRMFSQLLGDSMAPVPLNALDLAQGSLRETGGQLDLALEGPGFFVVGTPQGERLIRGGAFQLDPAGQLVDAPGDPVLGVEGAITILGSEIEVQVDGSIVVDGEEAGILRIENAGDAAELSKEGLGRFQSNNPTESVNLADTRVRQGAIEESNVNMINGMVDLVTIQREFQANMNALKALDEMLGNVTNNIGRPT